jgi:hypothetical protein
MILSDVAAKYGGLFDPETKLPTYVFDEPADAIRAATDLGAIILPLPDAYTDRRAMLTVKAGKVQMVMPYMADDMPLKGWYLTDGKKRRWILSLGILADQRPVAEIAAEYDDLIRDVVAKDANGIWVGQGWHIKSKYHGWGRGYTTYEAGIILLAQAIPDPTNLLGHLMHFPWRRTHVPFAPVENRETREWNQAAQYMYQPSAAVGPHPTWDAVLAHCGASLNSDLADGHIAGITSGADYLLTWAALMLREPSCRLPYLFFWGPQNGGKSSYHEALALLMTADGTASADRALTSDKNGELCGRVLVYTEETNIAKCPSAYARIKDLTTSSTLTIRRMRTDAYATPNFLHFVQTANERDACPIVIGDTRIVVAYVDTLASEIPKPQLLDRLRAEAPNFMRTIMDLPLPKLEGRLALPVIETGEKAAAQVDSLPPIIHGVIEMMEYTPRWTGNAAKLLAALPSGHAYPTDARKARSILDRHIAYLLSQHGISVAMPEEKTEHGKIITLTR